MKENIPLELLNGQTFVDIEVEGFEWHHTSFALSGQMEIQSVLAISMLDGVGSLIVESQNKTPIQVELEENGAWRTAAFYELGGITTILIINCHAKNGRVSFVGMNDHNQKFRLSVEDAVIFYMDEPTE